MANAGCGVLERNVRQAVAVVARKVLRLIMGCDDVDRMDGWVDLGVV